VLGKLLFQLWKTKVFQHVKTNGLRYRPSEQENNKMKDGLPFCYLSYHKRYIRVEIC